MYTGEAQSWNKYDAEGLVGNDQISAVVEGSITFPNESPVANTVKSYAFTSGTADNYDVTTKNGELTMTYANAAITITAASNSWVYDGNAHTAPEVTITQGALLAGDELVATASGSVTDVADTKNGNNPVADGYKVMHGDKDVSANYAITTEAGTLTITIKTVDNPVIILTPESFEYDGTPIEQKPAVVVKDGDRIIPDSEYSVSYSNNIEVGIATVTITDNEGGNYIVNGTVNFTIGDKTFDWNGVKIVVTDYANHLAKVIELTPNPYGSVVIPESIEGYTITTIDPDAVKGKTDLTDIFLPDTKEPLDIKEGAFYINDNQTPAVHVTEELLNDYALIPALDKQLETANLVTELSSRNRYRTFACVVDVIIPEDLGVYTCHHESTSVRMTPLDNKELMVGGQRMIRAGNGVLLICAKYGNEIRAKKPESQNFYQGNELVAVTTDTHFAAGEYYVLKDNEFHVIDADDVSSVKAGHAVLPVKDKNARSLTIIGEDDATRINAVDSDEAGDIWYDLMGNRISRPLRKGLYIHNGKKEIVR